MKKYTFEINRLITLVALAIFGFVLTQSVSAIDYNKMNLVTDITSKIYNLNYLDSNLSEKQANRIMKSGFLSPRVSETYGYFKITLRYESICITSEAETILSAATIGLLTFGAGVITKYRDELYANVEIYNCNKELVAKQSAYNSTIVKLPLYADWDKKTMQKIEPIYRKMLKGCLTNLRNHSDEINNDLMKARYPPKPKPSLMETVIPNVFKDLIASEKILQGSSIAILGVNPNIKDGTLVTRGLESQFVSANQYRMIERSRIDLIISEQLLNESVFANTDSAIKIGKLLAAQVIILGDIDGEDANRTLLFRALDVTTGEILAVSTQNI
jgi:hypothetical protein